MSSRRLSVLVSLVFVLAVSGAVALAGGWQPYGFKEAASYKYRIANHAGGETTELVYTLALQPTDKTVNGQKLWKVATTNERFVPEGELEAAGIFGLDSVLGVLPTLMLGHPLFSSMVGEMELKVGEKMSFFGAGRAEVVGKEKVAGVEGFVCHLFMKQDDGEQKVAELVVNPDLPLPLRSRTFEDGELRFEMELIEYRKP